MRRRRRCWTIGRWRSRTNRRRRRQADGGAVRIDGDDGVGRQADGGAVRIDGGDDRPMEEPYGEKATTVLDDAMTLMGRTMAVA